MVLPAVIVLLCFAIFPLIISAYLALSRFALAPGGFTLKFIGLLNFKKLLTGSQQYHLLGTFGTLGAVHWLVLALVAGGAALALSVRYLRRRPTRPRARSAGCSRRRRRMASPLVAVADLRAGRRAGNRRQHAALRGRRRDRAVRARARPGAALRPADPRPQLLPRAVLHSADGDPGRHRLHLPHARRHAEGAVRPARCAPSASANGRGRPRPGRRG